ncbi:LPXTG cell wall anchor domain-containing protein [Streptomyces sp. NPDC006798]|uniref:LPXTG cell wall anchor domain-containing protein n=1 Tax=Streptomyces sp. NPDC006798 TaxID=3155462 RepID=UPI00340DC7D2
MKLRRAAAVAAASAVLAPLALLSTPAAHATGVTDPASSTSTGTTGSGSGSSEPGTTDPSEQQGTGSTGGTTTPGTGAEQGEGDKGEQGETGKEPGGTAGQGGEQPGGEKQPGTETPGKGEQGETGTAPGTGGQPPKGSEGGTQEEAPNPDECTEGDYVDGLKTSLRGAPSQIVAGGGWRNFTYRISNETGKDIASVTAVLDADASDENGEDAGRHITIEAKYDGAWEKFEIGQGYLGEVEDLGDGEFAEVELRMKADAKAPAATGFLLTIGLVVNQNGSCDFGEPVDYEFEVLPVGGKPDDKEAEGKPGKNKPGSSDGSGKNTSGKNTAPQGERKEVPVTGNLAQTGSSDVLPVIGIAGGIAIVAGAGVVFALKRRRDGATA